MYEARKAKRAANGTGPDIVEENRRLSQGETSSSAWDAKSYNDFRTDWVKEIRR
jgi:hypothetical protein